MFETPITIVGNIVTDPLHRQVGEQEVVKFRMASNARRKTADGTWENVDTLFVSVSCWGRLVPGTAGVLLKGDPVIVTGYVCTSEYEKEGVPRTSVDLRATAVGPDLSRCSVRIDRSRRAVEPARPDPADVPAGTPGGADAEDAEDGLPLTA